jgi:hypothetical protein
MGTMPGPSSTPSERRVVPLGTTLTAKGTIVGMPAMVKLSEELSTTLRSARMSDAGPPSDALHPERWSQPPSTDLPPIIPCDEPEDEDVARVLPSVAPPPPPTPAVAQSEPAPQPLVNDPVVLPMGRRVEGDRGLVVLALVVSLVLLAAGVSALLLLY